MHLQRIRKLLFLFGFYLSSFLNPLDIVVLEFREDLEGDRLNRIDWFAMKELTRGQYRWELDIVLKTVSMVI